MYEKDQLSREGWIMLLSGEINKEEMKLFLLVNHGNVILLTLLGGVAAAGIAIVQIGMVLDALLCFILIFEVLMITFALYWCNRYFRVRERLRPLINLREDIISGKLTDFSEIRRKWEEYIKKYYGKLLAKSEMDKEEKESKGEKDGSKEKRIWEKAMKSRKKSRKSLTRDIRDIKESLQEIKDVMEVTKFFNLFCVFGSLFVAGGLAIIFATRDYVFHFGIPLQLIGGFFTFLTGVSMIIGAVYEWTDLRKRKLKELGHMKRWLFVAFFVTTHPLRSYCG